MKKTKTPTTAPTPMATNVQSLAFFKASCAPVKSCISTHLRALLEKMMAGIPAAQQHTTVTTILSIKKVDDSDCIFDESVPFIGAAGCEAWLTVEAVPLPTGCGLFTGTEPPPTGCGLLTGAGPPPTGCGLFTGAEPPPTGCGLFTGAGLPLTGSGLFAGEESPPI